jgi:uncharacterized SAM-binding protein YcdF (DUF218 family)
MNKSYIDQLAQIIWDYHHLHHTLEPSDLILALGSNDIRVAEYAADLYLQGFAPRLMFSGNVGALTKDQFTKPEAEVFADIARQKGVPYEAILIEPESTNTGENIAFSRRGLAARGLDPSRIILVQKPYMERRAFATFRKRWPEKDVIVTSPPMPFAEYCNELLPRDKVINIMVGDLQRIKLYPARGFQIAQEIPDDVWQAYKTLLSLGYDQHLMKETAGRSRPLSALLIAVVIALGLSSRAKPAQSFLPSVISEYAGDTLYALLVFLGLGFLFPKLSTWRAAALAFGISVLIEGNQLYHAPWLDALRQTRLGGLVLGFGFLWSDLLCYAVGVTMGAVLERLFRRKKALP